jgi:hypothetical protein
MLSFPCPRTLLVAVGRTNTGPAPQISLCGFEGEKDAVGFRMNDTNPFDWPVLSVGLAEKCGCHVSKPKYPSTLLHGLGRQVRRCILFNPNNLQIRRSRRRLPDHRRDPANDHVPVLTHAQGNDRLDVQNILRTVKRTNTEVAESFCAIAKAASKRPIGNSRKADHRWLKENIMPLPPRYELVTTTEFTNVVFRSELAKWDRMKLREAGEGQIEATSSPVREFAQAAPPP